MNDHGISLAQEERRSAGSMGKYGVTVENLMRTFPLAFAEDKNLQALGKAIAEELVRRAAETKQGIIYPNIEELPERLLDILAYDFKVDWWDVSYGLEEKRKTLKDSWRIHRMLGTKAAVEAAISAFYRSVKVSEWFEYGGKPYFFKLEIDATKKGLTLEATRNTISRTKYYKNLRSHLEEIKYTVYPSEDCVLTFGGTMSKFVKLPIPNKPDDVVFQGELYTGGQSGVSGSLPIQNMPDFIEFQGTAYAGGQAGMQKDFPIPGEPDNIRMHGVLHTGGQAGKRGERALTEEWPTLQEPLYAGGKTGKRGERALTEQVANASEGLRTAGQLESFASIPLLETMETARETIGTGGQIEAQGTMPPGQAEDSINLFGGLRTGGLHEIFGTAQLTEQKDSGSDTIRSGGMAEVQGVRAATGYSTASSDVLQSGISGEAQIRAGIPEQT